MRYVHVFNFAFFLKLTPVLSRTGLAFQITQVPLLFNRIERKENLLNFSAQDIGVNLGAVFQSIVSLTSSLRGQLVKCFMTL